MSSSYTTTAPGSVNPPALSAVAPTGTTPAALSAVAPGRIFRDMFAELATGGRALKSRAVSAADQGAVFQGTVAGVVKYYQVTAGTDAESSPNVLHPVNYDAGTNAFVFTLLA
jgi:hypothetical protein